MQLKDLKRKTAVALVWSTVRSGIEQIFSFFIFLVLGRLLTPEDFGVVALAAGVVEVLRLLSWVGLYEAIIRAPVLDEATADTAFWTSVSIGLVLAVSVVLVAHPLALLFAQPTLEPVVQVMSTIVVVSALGITHTGRLARDFGHKALAMRALAANIAGGIAAMVVVWLGGGMWALVAQRLAAELIQTVAAWTALRWVPRFRFSRAAVRNMAGFGAGITIANLVNGINMRAQEAAVGLQLPVAAVGALRIASRLTDLIQQMVFMPANQATMVAFSKLQDDRENLQLGLLHAVRLSGLVACPCFLGLAAIGPDLVPWMFGHQWAASVPILQALCLSVVPTTIAYFLPPVQVAVGKTKAFAAFSVLFLVVGLGFTVVCARWGIVAVALGLSARSWVMTPLALMLLHRAAGVRASSVVAAIAPTFLASLVAAAPAYGLSLWTEGILVAPLKVGLEGTAYMLSYVLLLLAFGRPLLDEALGSVLPMMPLTMQGWLRR
jgi:O-antigen/teichoic acid export membrane protein